jgi:acyl carrier protein
MSDRVITILSEVLRLPVETLNDQSSPENTSRWDSLAAVNLILAIEEEFGIKLTTREIGSMRSTAAIRSVLRARGVHDV